MAHERRPFISSLKEPGILLLAPIQPPSFLSASFLTDPARRALFPGGTADSSPPPSFLPEELQKFWSRVPSPVPDGTAWSPGSPRQPNGSAPVWRTAGSRREPPEPDGSPQAPAASAARPSPGVPAPTLLRSPFVSCARPPWRAPGPDALPGPGRLQRGSLLGLLWRRRQRQR